MKMHPSPWHHLSGAARARWPQPAPPQAPPLGFHSRVLSRVARTQSVTLELWWQMSVRALPVAAAVVLLCWLVLPAMEWEADLTELVMEEALP